MTQPFSVFLVIHDDRHMDTGGPPVSTPTAWALSFARAPSGRCTRSVYIRTIHTTSDGAKAAVPQKRTRNTDGHDWHCCSVEEWPVEDDK